MTKLTDMGWIQVVWNRKHTVMFRKYGMLVLDTFIGHSKLYVRSEIQAVNTDHVTISRWMTS
jgi:hypothetical protein